MNVNKNPSWIKISNDCYKQYKNVRSLIEFCYINNIKVPSDMSITCFRWTYSDILHHYDICVEFLTNGNYCFYCNINQLINNSIDVQTLPSYIYDRLEQYFRE